MRKCTRHHGSDLSTSLDILDGPCPNNCHVIRVEKLYLVVADVQESSDIGILICGRTFSFVKEN